MVSAVTGTQSPFRKNALVVELSLEMTPAQIALVRRYLAAVEGYQKASAYFDCDSKDSQSDLG